jgi:hypothetical protein
MPDPQVGEKFLIQVRKRRNRPSATFTIEVQDHFGRVIYRVVNIKYPRADTQRTIRSQLDQWYWYTGNPPSWWDSGSWPRLIVKAVKDRRERMDRALRPTT